MNNILNTKTKETAFVADGIDLFLETIEAITQLAVSKKAADAEVTLKTTIHIDYESTEVGTKSAISYNVPEKGKVEVRSLPGEYRLNFDDDGVTIIPAMEQEKFSGYGG